MLSYLGEMIDFNFGKLEASECSAELGFKRPLFLAANMDKLAISYPMDYHEWNWPGLRSLETEVELFY